MCTVTPDEENTDRTPENGIYKQNWWTHRMVFLHDYNTESKWEGQDLCQDHTKLNKHVKHDLHILTTVDHLLAQLGEAKVMNKLDVNSG